MPLSISLRDDVAELLNVPVVLLFFFFSRLEFDDAMREMMLSNLNDKADDIYNNDHQINQYILIYRKRLNEFLLFHET